MAPVLSPATPRAAVWGSTGAWEQPVLKSYTKTGIAVKHPKRDDDDVSVLYNKDKDKDTVLMRALRI